LAAAELLVLRQVLPVLPVMPPEKQPPGPLRWSRL
jgi:hypothetical protein